MALNILYTAKIQQNDKFMQHYSIETGHLRVIIKVYNYYSMEVIVW